MKKFLIVFGLVLGFASAAILPEIFVVARIKKPVVLLMEESIVQMKMSVGQDVGM